MSRWAVTATALDIAQFVRQRLRHHLHAGLRHIVGRVAGRTGDALLRAGVDDRRVRSLGDHVGREGLDPVDDAPEIDLDDAPPARRIAEQFPASPGPGVVHEERDLAEGVIGRGLQALHVVGMADVDGEGSDAVRARGRRADLGGRGLERRAIGVGHAHSHPERGEFDRRGKANAARRSGYDRDPVRRQCGMTGHSISPDVRNGDAYIRRAGVCNRDVASRKRAQA